MPEEAAVETGAGVTSGKELVYAARTGDLETVRQLLSDGVSVGYRERTGAWTALKWAASEGYEEMLALLLDHGAAEAEARLQTDDAEAGVVGGGTPLHWAAYKGHVRLVWRLLLAKPKPTGKELDAELNTPLHGAAAGGHLPVIKTLLAAGVDVNVQNAYGNLPVQLSTSAPCQALLREAAAAAKEGRYYLCACSGVFCTADDSVADTVIDHVSAPNRRPVRYSSDSSTKIRAAEDALTAARQAATVAGLQAAIEAAVAIGASLPLIDEATAGLERLKAEIALRKATEELHAARPVTDRALLEPIQGPLAAARETKVAAAIIDSADTLCQTVEAEVTLREVIDACELHKMVDEGEEEGAETEPPSAESDEAKRAEEMIAKLAGAIAKAQAVEVMDEVVDAGEAILSFLSSESELRKSLLAPRESTAEDGTQVWTEHNDVRCYSVLEDLNFRNDFLDSSLDKCTAAGTAPGILLHATKVQATLKAALKQAQADEEERKKKEEAAAKKAAKKKKK